MSAPAVGRGNGQPRFWTLQRRWELATLLEQGRNLPAIAAELSARWGRPMSASSISLVISTYGMSGPYRAAGAYTARRAAAVLGVHPVRLIEWATRGWMPGRQAGRTGGGRLWQISRDDLVTWVEDRRYWSCWDPAAITDPVLRHHALAVRAADPHVTLRAAVDVLAQRGLYVSLETIRYWILTSHLPAVKGESPRARWMIPVSALTTIQPPPIGAQRGDRSHGHAGV